MPRSINLQLFRWFGELLSSFLRARQLLSSFKPEVVFGTGGYVTAPVLLAAMSLKIPYVIHEPDAHPGLVNRVMSRWSAKMPCAFEAARQRLRARNLVVTGNPLRSQIGAVSRTEALARLRYPFSEDKTTLLVTGGSQGARRINQAVLDALPGLLARLYLQVILQTGDKLFDEVQTALPQPYREHPAYQVSPFIADMGAVLALADIALCRSGSMTLSEMYRAHIPTLLAPYPYAAADHQRKNALASQEAGASLMIEDAELTGEKLVSVLTMLLEAPQQLETMRHAASGLAAPNATHEVIQILKTVSESNLS